MSAEVLVEVVRSGFVEGRHRGHVVALGRDGSVDWALGDVAEPVLPRSCNKPLQAVGMVRAGLDLPADLLALASASHSGEAFHLDGVRRILDGAGLSEQDLQNPPDHPFDPVEKEALLRAGGSPSALHMNCSGKHAAMLATCVANGWETATYLDPAHPLQVALRETFAEVTGEPVAVDAVDGCGAPLLGTSLVGLARGFRALALATDGPQHRVAEAIRRHPASVSGTRRDECRLLGAVPGAIGKLGAEACYVLALPDGRAFALKIEDGADRARPIAMAAALRRSGVDVEPGVDTEAIRATGHAVLLGGGVPVGELRAAF